MIMRIANVTFFYSIDVERVYFRIPIGPASQELFSHPAQIYKRFSKIIEISRDRTTVNFGHERAR